MNNTIIKHCGNCIFLEGRGEYSRCNRAGLYTKIERLYNSKCDKNFSGWVEKPPRRSLRKWFLDTFWNK